MERRFLLAFVLSLAVLLGYQYLLQKIYGKPPVPQQNQSTPTPTLSPTPAPHPERPHHTTSFRSEQATFVIDEENASISEVTLPDKATFVKVGNYDKNIANIWFESPKVGPLLWSKVEENTQNISFSAEASGLRIKKSFARGKTPFDLAISIEVTNLSAQTVPLYFGFIGPSSVPYTREDVKFFDLLVSSQGKVKRFAPNKIQPLLIEKEKPVLWLAIHNKYFSLLVRPEGRTSGYIVEDYQPDKFCLEFLSWPVELGPNQSIQETIVLYAGPTTLTELSKLGKWAEETVPFGWFGGVAKFLLKSLIALKQITGNYGIAIILMTCFISTLFLPLSIKSYKAMSKLKLLQPEMEKLRELYKDKPQKLNKEVMELYRKHKVNPLGGCLPFVVQMPIFIAFYRVLLRSIELKGASFWFIRDLALPDQAILLPFSLWPVGRVINLLPILMIAAMIVQQRFSGTVPGSSAGPEAEAQMMMMKFMPLFLGFVFYGLPSGLVLYWLTNTILSIGIQRLFIRT